MTASPSPPDIEPHLCELVFGTGAFIVAWAWVLVYYAASHALAGESPLADQIGLGRRSQEESLVLLLLPYLAACAAAAAISARLRAVPGRCTAAAVKAVEFVPSPVFNATLLAFLGRFSGGIQLCLLNLATSWAVAAAVHAVPTTGSIGAVGSILRNTVGFGLGLAWNTVVSRAKPLSEHLIASTLYLIVVILVAARLAAPEPRADSLRSRHAALLSFAARVVCAFTLADWLSAVVGLGGLLGGAFSLAALLVIAAFASALVARADLDALSARASADAQKKGIGEGILGLLVFVPCVWCCCPWVPVLWLLGSGAAPGVKDRWLTLTTDICALGASVIGTNLITGGVDSLAASTGICEGEACNPLPFMLLETGTAALITVAVLPVISGLVPPFDGGARTGGEGARESLLDGGA